MDDLGTLPATGTTPASDPDPDIPWWVLAISILVALGMAAALGVVLLRGSGSADPGAGPTHPDRWDKRVRPYVKVVERLRDLDFRHPVAVRFLPPAKFEKTVTSEEQELTEKERDELKQFTGTLRALGLVHGKFDLFDSVNDASSAGIAAHYSLEDQRITVRGTKLTPEVRSTLVHELTHALQDQHFQIGSRSKAFREASENGPDATTASVYTAIIEGDAMRVERLYRDTLGRQRQQALDGGQAEQGARAGRRLAKVPAIVRAMLLTPYALGSGVVETVAVDGGNRAIDDLLRDPPVHDHTLLDPFELLTDGTEVRTLPLTQARPGEKELDSGAFGAVTWYLMLAERLPLQDALAAADGWAGDTYLSYEADGASCVRLGVSGDGPAATDRLHQAVRRWAAATPAATRVARDGAVVRLEACDPGAGAPRGNEASQRALELVATRAGLGAGMVQGGALPAQARCLADGLVRAYPVKSFQDPDFGADDPGVQARIQQLAVGCR